MNYKTQELFRVIFVTFNIYGISHVNFYVAYIVRLQF
jgi:hypothetical protein